MARINLLPWRKEQRERRNKEFNLLAGATAGLAILAIILAFSLLNKDLSNQQDANKRIEDANAQLDVALKSIEDLEAQREQMLSQMKVIQDLQGRRSIPVRVWDDMARAIPVAMYLNNIKREADVITLTGFADNPNVVAALVRNLNASEWLDGSAVVSIKSKLEAYQETATQKATSGSNDKLDRPTYPEDNYIEFVVTTKVQNPQISDEEKAQAELESGGDVVLPPVESSSEPIPEVVPIGIENAPAPEVQQQDNAQNPVAPTVQSNSVTTTETQSITPEQAVQPATANGDNQAGGQQ